MVLISKADYKGNNGGGGGGGGGDGYPVKELAAKVKATVSKFNG